MARNGVQIGKVSEQTGLSIDGIRFRDGECARAVNMKRNYILSAVLIEALIGAAVYFYRGSHVPPGHLRSKG